MVETAKEQLLYPVGVDDLFITMMTKVDTVNSEPEYDIKIWRLPNIVKMDIKGNGTTKDKWASNKLFKRVSRQTQHELSLDHVSFPVELWDKMNDKTSKKGVAFTTTEVKEMPFFGLGFIGPLSDGHNSAVWYPRVQVSNAEEHSYETTEEEIEIKDISCSMMATGLLLNNVLYSDFNSARETATDLDVTTFMKQVIFDESQLETITDSVDLKKGG